MKMVQLSGAAPTQKLVKKCFGAVFKQFICFQTRNHQKWADKTGFKGVKSYQNLKAPAHVFTLNKALPSEFFRIHNPKHVTSFSVFHTEATVIDDPYISVHHNNSNIKISCSTFATDFYLGTP